MEGHFDRLLNVGQAGNSSSSDVPNAEKFVQSSKYTGFKDGYVFKLGEKGIGYYWDKGDNRYASSVAIQGTEEKEENARIKKRKLESEGKYRLCFIRFNQTYLRTNCPHARRSNPRAANRENDRGSRTSW